MPNSCTGAMDYCHKLCFTINRKNADPGSYEMLL